MLGKPERSISNLEPSELACNKVNRLSSFGFEGQLPSAIADFASRRHPITRPPLHERNDDKNMCDRQERQRNEHNPEAAQQGMCAVDAYAKQMVEAERKNRCGASGVNGTPNLVGNGQASPPDR